MHKSYHELQMLKSVILKTEQYVSTKTPNLNQQWYVSDFYNRKSSPP